VSDLSIFKNFFFWVFVTIIAYIVLKNWKGVNEILATGGTVFTRSVATLQGDKTVAGVNK